MKSDTMRVVRTGKGVSENKNVSLKASEEISFQFAVLKTKNVHTLL